MEPADDALSDLIDRARSSGMTVELRQEGDIGPLPALVDRARYRVVQEALTNATKHAGGAAVVVCVEQPDGAAVVTVTNGRPPDGLLSELTGGRRELLGGSPVGDPPAPAGSTCHYFRPDADLLGLGRVYRLCFADGRLVAKDGIPTGPREPVSRRGG
jgi:hypothetical protein